MGRAFSLSLAAHAALLVSFLLFSATQKPMLLPQIARPVRLVTYLEPAPTPRPRAETSTRPSPPAPQLAQPPIPADPPAPPPLPRVEIPAPESKQPVARTEPPPTETRPALSERLARRLSAAAPVEIRPNEVAVPRIASLQRMEPAVTVPQPVAAVPGAPTDREPQMPTSEVVQPVGYFPHAWYIAVLKEKVFARWSPPSEFFQSNRSPAALVSFRIDRAGRISGVTLKEASGSGRFDQSALAAVQGLGQIPALPEQYSEETLHVVIRFQNQR